ncbi:Oxidored-FMN domain-containing protein [Aphelenchoides bicaudatus]|nr:Oxidored-FMN domain-containing protein [Aphelenchoides bicaudatus]
MVKARIPVEQPTNAAVLGEALKFKTSGKVARNRFMKSAMSELISSYSTDLKASGIPTQRVINLYEKFGNGGFGLVLTGNISVEHNHIEAPGAMAISKEGDSRESRLQFRRLAEAGKSGGALFIGQLNHGGRQTFANINPNPFAVSDIPLLGIEMKGSAFGKPVALRTEQIKTEVIDRFVFAANRLHEAGFDGVELHAGLGFLLSGFLSPDTNNRTDKYGGTVEDRVRILDEIYRAIRSEIPERTGFIIGIKLNSAEFQKGGLEQNEIIKIAQIIDKIGYDFIELTGGTYEAPKFFHEKESTRKREAFFIEFSGAIRSNIKNAVVYLCGGFRTVPGMVSAVKNGDTDGVSIARPAAAEPDLPRKILNHGVQSAVLTQFENDFMTGLPAAQTQLAQAGSSDLREANGDVCYGISDFSDDAEANKFKEGLMAWYGDAVAIGKQGRMVKGVFEFKTRHKDVYGGLKNILKSPETNGNVVN